VSLGCIGPAGRPDEEHPLQIEWGVNKELTVVRRHARVRAPAGGRRRLQRGRAARSVEQFPVGV